MISIVDLFCGCGGLTLGAWEAARVNGMRLDVKLAVDVSADAVAVYADNFRSSPSVVRNVDIRKLLPGRIGSAVRPDERELRKETGAVDVIVAGPPCQGHSDLNNHTRRKDPRNGLYMRVIRAVEVLEPKAVLIENVPTVVHDRAGVIDKSRRRLERLGYDVSAATVDAVSLGLPQRRKRHVLAAVRGNTLELAGLATHMNGNVACLKDYIGDLEDEPTTRNDLFGTPSTMNADNRKRVAYLFEHGCFDLPNRLRPSCHRDKEHSYVSMYGRLSWDKPAQTITTGFGSMGQGRYVHPTQPRTLTPHEVARVQGFPDFYSFSRAMTRRAVQHLIGNAVPPRVGAVMVAALSPS